MIFYRETIILGKKVYRSEDEKRDKKCCQLSMSTQPVLSSVKDALETKVTNIQANAQETK